MFIGGQMIFMCYSVNVYVQGDLEKRCFIPVLK